MKKFWKHTGLALLYLAVFLLVQMWAGGLFTYGSLFSSLLASGGRLTPNVYENVYAHFWDMMDVVMVLCYIATFGMLCGLLIAQQGTRGILPAMGLRKPRSPEMLWGAHAAGPCGLLRRERGAVPHPPGDAPDGGVHRGLLLADRRALSLRRDPGHGPRRAILEEIVFRGLIYGNFKKVMPTWVALLAQRCSLAWCTVSSCGPGSPSCSRSPWA